MTGGALRRTLFVVACAAALLSCERSTTVSRRTVEGGVAVVSNPARLTAPLTLRLSDSALLKVGGLRDNADDEFDHLNGYLTGVLLSDGGLAVADWTRVRIFDARGEQTAVVGTEGSGPGEFRGLTQLCALRGDTILAFDMTLRRLSVISAQGTLVRQVVPLKLLDPNPGCSAEGVWTTQRFSRASREAPDKSPVVLFNALGVELETITALPSYDSRSVGQFISVITNGQSLFVSDPRVNEVRRYTRNGTIDRIIRMADGPRPMSERDAAFWLGGPQAARGSGGLSNSAPGTGQTTWPFYRGIQFDADQRLWVRDFPRDQQAPERWTVYDTTGVVIGSLELPRSAPREIENPRTRVMQRIPGLVPKFVDASGDVLVLLERDSDGSAWFVTRRFR